MKKLHPRVDVTDAQIDAAISRSKEWELYRPVATAVKYREENDSVAILFKSGAELSLPRKSLQGLEISTPAQLSEVMICDYGSGLRWDSLDVDHYIPYLLEGMFGNRRWMTEIGRLGGLATTDAKRSASRKNGRKGGRPKRERVPA
ncbi:MAG: DUF2442 domain-containing protein [Candidatus Eremiobacteraeota bacterium]|nr:DUF2442 domain-containing protein [Candidatus Eremiobacteraeota bacterium]